jgi:charged multivesicular body protein 7
MKDLNKIGGVEGVENVVERLQAEMDKADEVGKVLEEPLNGGVVIDEGEIDDELGAMEIEEKKAREEVEGGSRGREDEEETGGAREGQGE